MTTRRASATRALALSLAVLLLLLGAHGARARVLGDVVVVRGEDGAAGGGASAEPVAWTPAAAWTPWRAGDAMARMRRAMDALLADVGALALSAAASADASCMGLMEECLARCGGAGNVLANECIGTSSPGGGGARDVRVRCTCASEGGTRRFTHSSFRAVSYTSTQSLAGVMSLSADVFSRLLRGAAEPPHRRPDASGAMQGVSVVDLVSVGVELPDAAGGGRRRYMSFCVMHTAVVCLLIVAFVLCMHACLFSNGDDEEWEEEQDDDDDDDVDADDDEKGLHGDGRGRGHGLVTIVVPEREPLLSAYDEEESSDSGVQVVSMSDLLDNARGGRNSH